MISLTAIAISGGAIYAGLQVYDRIRGVKQKPWLMPSQNKEPQVVDIVDSQTTMSETEGLQSEEPLTSMSTTYRIAGVDLDRRTAIVVLTATTSIIHVTLARPLMVLNGIGSALLLIPHYFTPQLEPYRHETRDTLIAYTVVTFVGFYVVKDVALWFTPIGITCKLVEAGMLALLWHERYDHLDLPSDTVQATPADGAPQLNMT